MCLNSPCSQPCAKKMLGRHSKARPTTFGDVFLHLMRHFHTDKQCCVIGEFLPFHVEQSLHYEGAGDFAFDVEGMPCVVEHMLEVL